MSECIIFTEAERKVLRHVLESDWIRRDVEMATKDEIKEKPTLESAIKKLMRLIELAKEQGLVKYQ